MSRFLKLLCLLLSFSIEVRVRASSVFIETELGLQNISSRIAVKTFDANRKAMIAPKAVLRKNAPDEFQWIAGEGVIQSRGPVVVKSIYGKAFCSKDCVVALLRGEDKLSIHALSGFWNVEGLVPGNEVQLLAGSSVDLMSVGEKQIEFPYTLTLNALERYMSDFLSFKKNGPSWTQIQKSWLTQVEAIVTLYQDRAERQISSADQAHQRRLRLKALEKAETDRIRAEFRRRNEFQ